MRIKHIGFFLKDSIFDAERVMDDLVGYCDMEHTKQGTIYHLQIVVDGEIVRCKDCKHWKPEAVDNDDKHWKELHVCGYWRRWYEKTNPCTKADDFCSKGEKR